MHFPDLLASFAVIVEVVSAALTVIEMNTFRFLSNFVGKHLAYARLWQKLGAPCCESVRTNICQAYGGVLRTLDLL